MNINKNIKIFEGACIMNFNQTLDKLNENKLSEANEEFVKINLEKIDQHLSKNWSNLPKNEQEKAIQRYWTTVLKAKFEGKGEPWKSAKKLAEKAKTVDQLKKAIEKVIIKD